MPGKLKTATILLAILFLLAAAPAVSAAARAGDFPDTRGHWAEADVRFLAEKGVIGGYTDGNFYPAKNISRRELAKIVFALFPAGARATEERPVGAPDYPDIHTGWGQEYLQAAKWYLPGYTDGHFKPDKPATRFEVAWLALAASLAEQDRYRWEGDKLLLELPLPDENAWRQTVRFREFAGLPGKYRQSTAYLPGDPDKEDFYNQAGYFFTDLNPVALLAGAGIIKGYTDGTVGLDREVTRAETVAIVSRVLKTDFNTTGRYLLEPASKVYRPRTVQATTDTAADNLKRVGAYYRDRYSDPMQRARMVYNLLLHTFNYDWETREGLEQSTATDLAGLMRAGRGTDTGLVRYYTTLAGASGLTAQTVRGRATNPGDSGPHTWVELIVNGKSVPVDPTYGVCTGDLYFNNFDRWTAHGYQWIKE